MASLFDIGKSGLQSYRQALSVTGQNIANVNTEGYKRREADLNEVSGGQGDIYGVSRSSGLGVRVGDIKRSFDEFLLSKVRTSASNLNTSSSHLQALEQLQSVLLPGDGAIGNTLENFFSALQDVSNVPAEMGPRIVALQRGEAVADAFNTTAGLLEELRNGIATQAGQVVKDLNALAAGLSNINAQLTTSADKASKGLLDNRDQLIDQISKYAKVNVSLDAQGRATIRLGDSVAGPAIVNPTGSQRLSIEIGEERLGFSVESATGAVPTNQIVEGELAGHANGYLSVVDVMQQIDDLARKIGNDLNAAHRKGITLDGEMGGDLFVAARPHISLGLSNVGSAYTEMTVNDILNLPQDQVVFRYADDTGAWTGRDSTGQVVASGRTDIALAGLSISFIGDAVEGDEIIVDPSRGAARGMTFVPTRGEELAAAAARLTYADAGNNSTATMTAADGVPVASSDLDDISLNFGNNLASIASTSFLSDGPVAIIPATVDKIDLASLKQQSTVNFSIPEGEDLSRTQISIAYRDPDGNIGAGAFFLSNNAMSASGSDGQTLHDVANNLNNGGIRVSATGLGQVALADIGAHAAADDGKLVFSFSDRDALLGNLYLSSGPTQSGELTSRNDTASTVHVFTREGRHIAGSTLDAADQATFLTADNGFLADAVYNSTYLNQDGGYLGVGIDRRATSTENLIQSSVSGASGTFDFIRLTDIDGGVASVSGASAHAESASYTLNIEGMEHTVTAADFGADADHADVARAMITKFRDTAPVATLTGSAVTDEPADGSSVALSFEGQTYTLSMVDGEVAVSGGEDGRIRAFFSNDDKLYISSTSGSVGAESISVLGDADITGNAAAAATFGLSVGTGPTPAAAGFSAYDYRLTLDGARISVTRTDTTATLSASASASSHVGERVTLTDLPDEELIVFVAGGARRLTAAYDELPTTMSDLPRDITVRVRDAATGLVDFVDVETGTSLATRTLDADLSASALGLDIELGGVFADGDEFHVTNNQDGTGDARNLLAMASLQAGDDQTGGFQQIFSNMISDVGSRVQSVSVARDAADELYNASLEIEASYSGVSLDSEAANLIQQQQAYQASARILMTARELFQTLLDVV